MQTKVHIPPLLDKLCHLSLVTCYLSLAKHIRGVYPEVCRRAQCKLRVVPIVLIGITCLLSWYTTPGFASADPPDGKPARPVRTEDRPGEQSGGDTLYKKTQHILELLEQLESRAAAEQKTAFEKLKKIGPPIIPFLIDQLENKSIYLELATQVQAQQLATPEEIRANTEILQEMMGQWTDKEVGLIEKYLYARYLEATQYYQKAIYQRALEIVDAILCLEPRISFREKLKYLCLACKRKLIQQNILKASLRTPKEIYEIGDKILITLRLENVTLEPVEINLGQQNFIILYRKVNEYGPLGNFETRSRMEEIKLSEPAINLKPQATWEHTFIVDTSQEGPSIYYRTYELSAEIRPLQLKSQAGASIRKIVPTPLLLRLFPPDVEPVLQNPLAFLGKALEGGIPVDIFLCALLVPAKDQDKALTLLMKSLEKSSPKVKKTILTCLKHMTRLPVELDETAWRNWWAEREKRKK